jgi:lipid-A-disaccharide synthase
MTPSSPSGRVLIVAGEASGDLHGANLVAEALKMAPGLKFYGTGGPRLKRAGTDLMFDLNQMSMMGLTEAAAGTRMLFRIYFSLKRAITEDRPDGLVLVDYPELNLRLAKTAKRAGVPVFYYPCPQIWAWRTGRVKKMGYRVDRRAVMFPFEVDFYRRHGFDAHFVGHTLVDVMPEPKPKPEAKAELGLDPDRELIVLMPGSRRHLVRDLLPLMLDAAALVRRARPEVGLALARSENLDGDALAPLLARAPDDLKVMTGRSHQLQNAADAVLTVSGTSTLETALMLTPMVVVYRLHGFSYFLARRLIHSPYASLANLIAGRRVVPELLQHQARPDLMADHLYLILSQPDLRRRMTEGLAEVRDQMGGPGVGRRAAELLLDTIAAAK